ncbi:MAG TPA: hypothetical protein VGX76_16535, partial [Pirellulales bacterium]|nr:hypothetical protein [Pirellulales bacterium]
CTGVPVEGVDGSSSWGEPSQGRLREDLLAALRFNDCLYELGISDDYWDPAVKDWYLREIRVTRCQVTFVEGFVDESYARLLQSSVSSAALVARQAGDFAVPTDVLSAEFDIDRLVERLLWVDRWIERFWSRPGEPRRSSSTATGSARRRESGR